MKDQLYAVLLLLFVLAVGPARTLAQSVEPDGIRLNGVVVYPSIFATGRTTAEGFTRALSVSDDTLEMALINQTTGVFIGYGLQVEPLDQAARVRVSIKPLTAAAINGWRESVWVKKLAAKWPNKTMTEPQALPRYPAPQVVNLGDSLKLELWLNAATGGVIGDRLRFELDAPDPARAFTLADVHFEFTGFRLSINGEIRSGERSLGGFSGPLPWFAVPGKGRFLISLQPHAGYDFQQIGLVEGKKLSFSEGGDGYEWVSNESILPTRGRWRVWVLHDKDYQTSATALADVNLVSKGNCCLYGTLGSPAQIFR
jgi:hypothetical protein